MTTETEQDHRLTWALDEVLGGQTPPDLAATVAARWRTGAAALLPEVPEAMLAPTRDRRWLAAAALLVGAGVVAALAWRAPVPHPSLALPHPPADPVQVSSRSEIEALPVTTRAVHALGIDDDAVLALTRLRDLRWLEISYPEAMALGLGLKTTPPAEPKCVTARCLTTLSQMPTLQTLRLRGAYAITEAMPMGGTGGGPEAIAAATLGLLSQLPQLEDLALTHFDTPAYVLSVLPRLRSLRRLDLTANYGADGDVVAALVKCHGLEVLLLRGCMTLPGNAIAQLGELPELRELDLSDIDQLNWRSTPIEVGPTARAWHAAARGSDLSACGVTDAALVGLARAKQLRTLRIAQPRCSVSGLAALRSFPALQALDLFGFGSEPQRLDEVADLLPPLHELVACGAFGDAFCRKLRASQPRLRRLELPACYPITDTGLAELLQIATLTHLDIRQSRGLTEAAMVSLRVAKQLEWLDLRHIDWVTAEHVRELRQALPRLRMLRANVGGD